MMKGTRTTTNRAMERRSRKRGDNMSGGIYRSASKGENEDDADS